MNSKDAWRQRIIDTVMDELTTFEDGFVYWYPSEKGAFSSASLRVIADYIDQRNEVWQGEIDEYFENNEGC
jgi:putative lipoic acid-binding regulatory protein